MATPTPTQTQLQTMSDEERPDEPQHKHEPTGETLLGGGYSAGEDIAMLVPPPNDMGIGVSPVASEGAVADQPRPSTAGDSVSAGSETPATESRDNESGTISVDVAFLILAFSAGAALIHLIRDDARTLILILLICAVFGLGYQMGERAQTT